MVSAAPQTPFDVRHSSRGALTPIEQRVLDICESAARDGRELDSIEDMRMTLGALSYSTVPGIMKRLEAKGLITRRIYQKGRVVCIAATGKCTAEPRNTAPHWRFRTDRTPTPTIQSVAQRAKPVAAMIEAEARLHGKSLTDFLGDLVYIGWHEYQAEKEQGE